MPSVGHRVLSDGTVRWRVQGRYQGRMMQKTFFEQKGATEFNALVDKIGWPSALQVLEVRLSKGEGVTSTPTLREWMARYLDADAGLLTGIEEGTRYGYQRAAERSFLQVLGDYPVDVITKADVGRWVAWQEKQITERGKPMAMKTVQNYHSILSSALKAAVDSKLREDNPAWRTRITRGQRREGVFLSPDEFATILHFIPERYTGFVMFLAGSGCRWGEATAITWSDVDLTADPPIVRINKAWKKAPGGSVVLRQPKSKRSKRSIGLDPDTVQALGHPGRPSALVFPNTTGGHMWHSAFREDIWVPAIRKAQDRALCELEGVAPLTKTPTLHDLRHTHASWLIADGAPLPYVQARLGHESINTTVGVYGHLQPDAHAQMAAFIGRRMSGVRPLRRIETTRG